MKAVYLLTLAPAAIAAVLPSPLSKGVEDPGFDPKAIQPPVLSDPIRLPISKPVDDDVEDPPFDPKWLNVPVCVQNWPSEPICSLPPGPVPLTKAQKDALKKSVILGPSQDGDDLASYPTNLLMPGPVSDEHDPASDLDTSLSEPTEDIHDRSTNTYQSILANLISEVKKLDSEIGTSLSNTPISTPRFH